MYIPGCHRASHRGSRQELANGGVSAQPSRDRSRRRAPARHQGERDKNRHRHSKQTERIVTRFGVRRRDAEHRFPERGNAARGRRPVRTLRDDQRASKQAPRPSETSSTQLHLRGVQVRENKYRTERTFVVYRLTVDFYAFLNSHERSMELK